MRRAQGAASGSPAEIYRKRAADHGLVIDRGIGGNQIERPRGGNQIERPRGVNLIFVGRNFSRRGGEYSWHGTRNTCRRIGRIKWRQ